MRSQFLTCKVLNRVLFLAALLLAANLFSGASPSTSTLRVAIKSGSASEYVVGAHICVGDTVGSNKYGFAVSGSPYPSFAIPDDVTNVVVTVSKSGYTGVQDNVTVGGSGGVEQTKWISLSQGSGGPTCMVPRPTIPQIPISITSFQINGGQSATTDRTVTLNVVYGGTPTHYQVSESADFTGAPWKEMPASGNQLTYNFDAYAINVPTSISSSRRTDASNDARPALIITRPSAEKYGPKTLYVRMKNAEFVSGKRSDSIELKLKLKQYRVQGAELKELLKYAKEQGFTFSSGPSPDEKCPGFQDGTDLDIPGVKFVTFAQCSYGVVIEIPKPNPTKVVTGTFFGGRQLNANWRIAEFTNFVPGELWHDAVTAKSGMRIIKTPNDSDPSFSLEVTFVRKTHWSLVGTPTVLLTCSSCLTASVRLSDLVMEGPEEDSWLDSNRKWKNAFRR